MDSLMDKISRWKLDPIETALCNVLLNEKFQRYKGERRAVSPNQRGLTNSFTMSERVISRHRPMSAWCPL